ncbi:MAG: hypothetical protein AAF230_06935 [Pseudomonadota bacterium]
MGRADGFLVTVVFAVFVVAYGALSWAAGGLFVDTHEGDTYHLLDILSRLQDGAVPHLDFVTPLGALAFWPVHWIIQTGQTTGAALILSQIAFAFCLLPFVAYAASTRLTRGVAIYFGLTTLGVVLALSYGTATAGVGISMHYNRWAWGVSFAMLLLALVPARGPQRAVLDGILIGLLAAALLLLKITYFATLVPVAAIALWQMHRARGLLSALIAGTLVVAAVTVMHGVSYWFGYLHDLRLVSSTDIRPSVGKSFDQIAADPTHLGATLAGILTALILRRSAAGATGLAALLLIPGFMFITYQNFGNDPHWLVFLPVLILAYRPTLDGAVFGFDAQKVATVAAVSAFAVFFPSFANLALSPLSHLSLDKSGFQPMLPEGAGHDGIFIRQDRAYNMAAQVFRDQEPGPWAPYTQVLERAPLAEFQGVVFPECNWLSGSKGYFETLGGDLAAAGLPEGSRLLNADLMAAFWFFAPVSPPEGSAPWYYGRLTGLENTDYIMVPKCAFATPVRNIMLQEMAEADVQFTLVRDNDLMALFRVGGG